MPPRFSTPFEPLQLSVDDATRLGDIARVFVQDHMRSYEKHLHEDQRRLDERRWKLAKQREGVRVYAEQPLRERRKSGGATQDELEREYRCQQRRQAAGAASGADKASAAAAASLADLPVVLAVGTIAGTLEDVMYGAVNSTVETMRIKSSYVGDNVADGAVLVTLVEPSASDPFHSLTVKWMENGQPQVLRPVVKNRDFVYVEVTGLAELTTGERVGYHLLHSVHFPQTPELDARVRGSMSVCGIYRQEREGLVGVYVRAILNPGGSIMRSLAVKAGAEAIISVTQLARCAQLKKLAWLARTGRDARDQRAMEQAVAAAVAAAAISSPSAESTGTSSSSATTQPSVAPSSSVSVVTTASTFSQAAGATSETCTSCQKRSVRRAPSGSMGRTISAKKPEDRDRCKICYRFVCSSCKVVRRLSFVTPQGELLRRELRFCGRCVADARAADALTIASEEVAAGDQFADYYQCLSSRSGDSSLSISMSSGSLSL
ncbi:hypothetical protein BBJ28_00013381 [Nothophytophthora sp. Chile5]|nr:hypothetical protein BBJ28_00013381 [Nothophytophthora sp. Chile5]